MFQTLYLKRTIPVNIFQKSEWVIALPRPFKVGTSMKDACNVMQKQIFS